MDELQRLALAIRTLDEQRSECAVLSARVNALHERRFIIIEGEQAALGELEALLEQGRSALQMMAAPGSVLANELATLEQLAGHADWSLLDFLKTALLQKEQEEARLRDDCEVRLNQHRGLLDKLRDALDEGRAKFVVGRADDELLRDLDDLETRARRDLARGRHELFDQSLQELADRDVPKRIEEIEARTREAPQHWCQAELLFVRSPQERQQLHHYSVLLRTPDEAGVHGVNNQGSSSLPHALRELLLKEAAEIRGAARGGLRDAGSGSRPPGPAQGLEARARTLGRRLYRVIVPPAMQDYLAKMKCSVTVTTNDLELPWELMHGDDTFLCLDRPVSRMPVGAAFPRTALVSSDLSPKLRFLLIGANPRGDLPAVARELERISAALKEDFKQGIEIDVPPNPDVAFVTQALMEGRHDVIHYAGHAFFDPRNPQQSALELHDDALLAENIGRMLAGKPVVFLNGCETGSVQNVDRRPPTDGTVTTHAQGLASAFLYGGALGCIGNLWPVDDTAAADFAIDFYRNLIGGHTIGKSMLLARQTLRRANQDQIPWASFVLYGNPLFPLKWNAESSRRHARR